VITREEHQRIWEEVKENHRKLDSCKKHSFDEDVTPDRVLGKTYKCTSCGGTVDSITKSWYELGLKHAGS
jgi:hypothetical protein